MAKPSIESLLKQSEDLIGDIRSCHEELLAALSRAAASPVVIPLGLILAKSAQIKFNVQERF